MFQTDLFTWGENSSPADFVDFGLIGDVPSAPATPAPAIIPASPKPAVPCVVLKPGSPPADVQAAWQSLPTDLAGKVKLTFSEPVSMRIAKRKMSEPKTVHHFRLFIGNDHGSEVLAYTNSKRTGWAFGYDLAAKLVSIEGVLPVTEADQIEKVRKLANRIHPNAWSDLKEKLLADPSEYFRNYGYTIASIAGKFPDYVLDGIRHAFENKTQYSYRKDSSVFAPTHSWGGTSNRAGRDLKVECKLCDDGIFRAWYSSEFSGCLNGDYWLLINPTTAAFKERD